MKSFLRLALAFSLLLAITPAEAAETFSKADAQKIVKTFYNDLTSMMKQGKEIGFEGRYAKIKPSVEKAFNLPLMTKFAVGRSWSKTPRHERDALTDSFSKFSIATYASRFTKFDGEKFDVLGATTAPQGGIIVETNLTPSGSEPIALNYLIRADEAGKPRITDVFLDATISELATRRAEFTAIIKKDNTASLIETLNEKINKMKEAN